MNKSGFTLIETLISCLLLAMITLSAAGLYTSTSKGGVENLKQVEESDQVNYLQTRMNDTIGNASYIFPPAKTITLGCSIAASIDTDNAIAMLIRTNDDDKYPEYQRVALFLVPNGTKYDVYQFSGEDTDVNWTANTLPSRTFGDGICSKILSDVASYTSPSVDYELYYNDGVTDSDLKGLIGNATAVTNDYALISRVTWTFSINKGTLDCGVTGHSCRLYRFEGVSKNVPRYIPAP